MIAHTSSRGPKGSGCDARSLARTSKTALCTSSVPARSPITKSSSLSCSTRSRSAAARCDFHTLLRHSRKHSNQLASMGHLRACKQFRPRNISARVGSTHVDPVNLSSGNRACAVIADRSAVDDVITVVCRGQPASTSPARCSSATTNIRLRPCASRTASGGGGPYGPRKRKSGVPPNPA